MRKQQKNGISAQLLDKKFTKESPAKCKHKTKSEGKTEDKTKDDLVYGCFVFA